MSNVDRALSIVENAVNKMDRYDARSVSEAVAKVIEHSEKSAPKFYERAWFIHGFWAGIVLSVLVLAYATNGTLIYDLLVKK